MKRILLAVVAAGLLFGGGFVGTAQADDHGHRGHHHHGHQHHGHQHGGHHQHGHSGYGGYRSGYYTPYNVYTPRFAPYGAGYSGGYQPNQSFYYQQPRFGLYLGF